MRSHVLKAFMLILLVGLFAPAALAQEEGPVWSYVEAGYLSVDPDNVSDSGDNWFAGGSVGIFKNFHAFARYISGEVTPNTDLTYWEFGAGWHGLLGEKADLLAEATWVDSEVANVSENGYGLTGGLRWVPIKLFELDAFVNWQDLDTSGSVTGYEARAILNFWRMGIGASYEFSDDANQWNAFLRFNFGKRS